MQNWWRMHLLLFVWLAVSGCVSTGVQGITDPGKTDRLEAGKSSKSEVTALLGFPAIVTYGPKGQETWDYYYVTAYPRAIDFVPVMVALADGFNQTTRVLTVSFDRQGLVQNLHQAQTSGKAEVFPY
jgi:outer membrane protein assembly factor BamE (lipoprotein component of BamABCDE complex)